MQGEASANRAGRRGTLVERDWRVSTYAEESFIGQGLQKLARLLHGRQCAGCGGGEVECAANFKRHSQQGHDEQH